MLVGDLVVNRDESPQLSRATRRRYLGLCRHGSRCSGTRVVDRAERPLRASGRGEGRTGGASSPVKTLTCLRPVAVSVDCYLLLYDGSTTSRLVTPTCAQGRRLSARGGRPRDAGVAGSRRSEITSGE